MNQEQTQLLYNPRLFSEHHLFYVLKNEDKKHVAKKFKVTLKYTHTPVDETETHSNSTYTCFLLKFHF